MSHWNYRLFKDAEDMISIIEVYYDKSGKPEMRAEPERVPEAGTVDEMRETLAWMMYALDKPVLNESDFFRESNSCFGCGEQTKNADSICDKCIRDPKTNVCCKCGGNPVETKMEYVCSECVMGGLDAMIDS